MKLPTIPRPFALYNIRNALLAFVLAPFLLVMIISGGYSLHKLEQSYEAGLEEEIALIARAIREPLSYALEHDDHGILHRTMTSASDIGGVYGVYVYDRNGKRISAKGPSKAQVQDVKAADLASRGNEQSGFEKAGNEEVFSYFMPLTNSGGGIDGLLQITRRGSDFVSQIQQFRTRALTVLSLSALLVLIIVWLGYQRAIGRHINAMGQSMRHVGAGNLTHRLATLGPSEIRVLASGINGMLDNIVASEHELDNRRQNELALKQQLYHSEKLAAIGRFAAGVAHELGTPLSVADGKLQRALRKKVPGDSQTLTDIRTQLHRMEGIIRQLMDFARPVPLERKPVNIADLVHSSLQQLSDLRRRQNVEINIHGQRDTPPIALVRLRMEQALINLVRNAIQASPGGQIDIRWRTTDSQLLEILIEDDGPGISEDQAAHILEPFVTSKSVGEGTGLGLAVVNAVITEHGGIIRIERCANGGARFRLTLPFNPADEPQHTP